GDSTFDLQASVPEVQLGLQRVGVNKVAKAVRIEHAGREQTFAAEIACTVDLDPAQKGVHMSRFPELFGEAVDEVVIGEALLVESLASHIASHVVERQGALRAEVRIEAQYPIERRTPVTGLPTQEIAKLIGIAAATRGRVRRVVGVEATGINACPCAQGLVRAASAARLLEAGEPRDDPRPRRARRARRHGGRAARGTRDGLSGADAHRTRGLAAELGRSPTFAPACGSSHSRYRVRPRTSRGANASSRRAG